MAISIRDGETDSLAREVAQMTGESLTEAIGKSLQERLNRLLRENDYEKRKAKIAALSARIRENMTAPVLTDDDLYDENGLPRED